MPAARASLRVQLLLAHVHPVPAMETSVKPEGGVSVIVTSPLVGPAPAALLTVIVYVAPFCPCVKLPVWAEATLRLEADASAVKFAVWLVCTLLNVALGGVKV